MHDATFGSYGEVVRGSQLVARSAIVGSRYGIQEGYCMVDGRYYHQFGHGRIVWANRVYGVKSFGKDRMIAWSNNLYRDRLFTFGTDIIQLQTELRFPILNWIAFQPAYRDIRSNKGIWGFRVNGCLFWYSGDVRYAGQGRHWSNRAGIAARIMLISNISLQYEYYWQSIDGKWSKPQNGWSLNIGF